MKRHLTALALVAALALSLVACDSSQPMGVRLTRTSGTQTLVYVVQPHANAQLDAAFVRAANTWSWNAYLEVRYVRSCPAQRSCIHVSLGDSSPYLGWGGPSDGSGLDAGHYHTAIVAIMWPFPADQNLGFVVGHELGHALGLDHGTHHRGDGTDGPYDYWLLYPTDHDQRTLDAIYNHPPDRVGSPGL